MTQTRDDATSNRADDASSNPSVDPLRWRPPASARGRRARAALVIAGLAGVAAIILLVLNSGDIATFAAQAARANPGWLLLALVSQISTYVAVALIWRLVLRQFGYRLSVWRLFPISVAKLFADQALPSGGVSGAAFFLFALARRKVEQTTAFSTFVFATAAFFAAFLTASVISLTALAAADKAPPALAASISVFAAVFIFLSLLAAFFFLYKPKSNPAWISKIPGGKKAADVIGTAANAVAERPGLFAQASVLQLIVRLIDGVTLYLIFLAIGAPAPLGVCFVAIVLASVAATIGPMPMGLGTFEAGMLATLTVFAVTVEDALTATMIYRGLSLWLPLLPGFAIIQRELLKRKIPAAEDGDAAHNV